MQRGTFGPFGYRLTPWVKRLIIANAALFLVVWLGERSGLLTFNRAASLLGFSVGHALTQPWTIISYMFVHDGFLHVFLNMLMLFFFGPPLEERWGGREFIKYYAICGIGGALLTLVFDLSFGRETTIVGASGAIYGVLLAYALNWPDSLVWIYAIFPIKVKYLVLFLGALSFFSAFPGGGSDGIAHFAHLGGLVVGFLYLKRGWLPGGSLRAAARQRLGRRRLRLVPGGASGTEKARKERSREADEEARMLEVVDALLDKIAAQGIDSLTREEREFLDQVSRRRRAKHEIRH